MAYRIEKNRKMKEKKKVLTATERYNNFMKNKK
jgi:hypothetical protein